MCNGGMLDIYFVEDDPGVPAGQFLDPFAGLDEGTSSVLAALFEGVSLSEGKAIGGAQLSANVGKRDVALRQRYAGTMHGTTTQRNIMKAASKNAMAALEPYVTEAGGALRGLMSRWASGEIRLAEMRVQSAAALRKAYEAAREIGRRASGLSRMASPGAPERLQREEESWFRDAVREELGYWHRFLEEIRAGAVSDARREERLNAYLRSIRFMYEAARIAAMPDNVLLHWMGPKKDDPNICLTGQTCRVTSIRGMIQLGDVVPGDVVWTHRGRWRRVTAVRVNRSDTSHRYAVVVGSGFNLFGLTQDHRVWTDDGWIEAEEAARQGKDVLRSGMGRLQAVSGGRTVFRDVLERSADAVGPALPMVVGAGVRADTRRACDSPQERGSYGRQIGEPGTHWIHGAPREALQVAAGAFGAPEAESGVPPVRGEVHGCPQGAGAALLFGGVSCCVVEADEARGGVRGVRGGHLPEPVPCEEAELLLSEVLRRVAPEGRHDDPAVRLLWEEFQAGERPDTVIHEGQVLLLSRVLPEESPLYDLTVDEDASFTVEGRGIHNCEGCALMMEWTPFTKETLPAVPRDGSTPCLSNCRHRIVARVARNFNDVIRRSNQLDRLRIETRKRPDTTSPRARMVKKLQEVKEEAHGGRRHGKKVSGAAGNPFSGERLPQVPQYGGRVGRMRMQESAVVPSWVRGAVRDNKNFKGPNGNVVVGYEHRFKFDFDYSKREGGAVERKVSDWDRAEKCVTCGKSIVHVYWVQDAATGVIGPYGEDHLFVVLGYPRDITVGQKRLIRKKVTNYDPRQEQKEQEYWLKHFRAIAAAAPRTVSGVWDYGAKRRVSPMRRAYLYNPRTGQGMAVEDVMLDKYLTYLAVDGWERVGWSALRKILPESMSEAVGTAHRTFDSVPYAAMDLRDVARLLVIAARRRDRDALLPLLDRVLSTLEHTLVAVEGRPRSVQVSSMLRSAFSVLVDAFGDLPEAIVTRTRRLGSLLVERV